MKNEKPKLSVIVPCFNVADTVERSLESVLRQDLRELEVVCVNDGSTDGTLRKLEAIASRDARVRVISQENQGAGSARNKGMKGATGEFVAFMDPDDWLPSSKTYATLYHKAIEYGVDVAGGNVEGYDRRNGRLIGVQEHAFEREEITTFSSYQFAGYFVRFIYRREFLAATGVEFPCYRRYQDPPFLARVLNETPLFLALPVPVYCYASGSYHVSWNEEKVKAWCSGVADVLLFSAENNLNTLHERTARGLFTGDVLYAALSMVDSQRQMLAAIESCFSCIDSSRVENREEYRRFERLIASCKARLGEPRSLARWAAKQQAKAERRDQIRSAVQSCMPRVYSAQKKIRARIKGR